MHELLSSCPLHPNNHAEDKTKAIRAWIPLKELRSGRNQPAVQANSGTELKEPIQVKGIDPSGEEILLNSSDRPKSPESLHTVSSASDMRGQNSPLIHKETNV